MSRPPSDDLSTPGDSVVPSLREERYESFVVRVLVGRDGDITRGQVTHVASGKQLHFTNPERVPDLIRRQLALASASWPAPDPKAL